MSALAEARAAQATATNALSVSRSSKSDISSVHLVQSQGLETEASLAFLRVVRGSFPTAAFDAAGLAELYNGKARVSRKFTEEKWPQQFRAARSAFVSATLSRPLPPPGSASHVLWADTTLPDGSVLKAQYVNPAFDNIEVDCLVKIEVRAGFEWKQDPDVARSSGALSVVSASAEASVPSRQAPSVSPVRWRCSSDESNASTCTALHYHPLANYYVIGEVYYPLHQGDKGCDLRHYSPAVQKLVQLERSLQFLSHKEGKPVGNCVAGALLIGPAFNHRVRAQLAAELRRFPTRFPCLCELNSRKRMLLLQLPHSSAAAVASFRDHERVLDEFATFKAQVEGRMADFERRLGPAAPATSATDPLDTPVETSPPVSPGAVASAVAASANASALLSGPVASDAAAILAPAAPTKARKKKPKKKKTSPQSQPAPLERAAEHADVVEFEAPSLLGNALAWLWRFLRL